jgi:hypothetical protein
MRARDSGGASAGALIRARETVAEGVPARVRGPATRAATADVMF